MALVTGFAVIALSAASVGLAGAQSTRAKGASIAVGQDARGKTRVVATEKLAQQADRVIVRQRARDDLERAVAAMQEIRVRPTIALSSARARRSGGVAGQVLAAADELELTEAQEEQIRGLQRDGRRDEIRRNADLEIAEMDLDEMMEATAADLDAIEQAMRAMANLQVDERMARLRLDRAVEAVLTDAQREQLDELSPRRVIFESRNR